MLAPYASRPQEKGQARLGVPIHVGDPTALAQVLPKARHLKATRQWDGVRDERTGRDKPKGSESQNDDNAF